MFKKLLSKKKKGDNNKKKDNKNTKSSPPKTTTTAPKSTTNTKPQKKQSSKSPKKSEFNEDIINQLSTFGYERSEIISAMRTVTDKNDINAIQSALDSSNDVLPEMKYTEPTKKQLKDIGCADITRKATMVNDSGTYAGYEWDKAYARDTGYWCSKDTEKGSVWVVIDVGKGGVAYVMFLKYSSSYAAKSVAISTADTPDASAWTPLGTVKTPSTTEDNPIPLGKGKNKQFIKIQFLENGTYIGVEYFQVYGKIGGSASGAPSGDGKGKGPAVAAKAMREISAAIPCVDHSKVYDGYPITNMYQAGSGYYCSYDGNNVYLTFDCGKTKISQWQFVCFLSVYVLFHHFAVDSNFLCLCGDIYTEHDSGIWGKGGQNINK